MATNLLLSFPVESGMTIKSSGQTESCGRQIKPCRFKPPFGDAILAVSHSTMSVPIPYHGFFDGTRHLFAVRIYFEDTDFSGVVYHARYLHFMERARSDVLARVGIDQRTVQEAGQGAYAVTELTIKYRRPARFDDALVVISTVEAVRAASCDIHQTIMRADEILTEAQVTAAFVSPGGKPRRQPREWVAAFQPVINRNSLQGYP
jgi:acyl-CoA thioester hydrolase